MSFLLESEDSDSVLKHGHVFAASDSTLDQASNSDPPIGQDPTPGPAPRVLSTEEKNKIKQSFIFHVEQRPALWSMKHPDYRDIIMKRGEWEVILELLTSEFGWSSLARLTMNTVPGLREQFSNLRTTYNKHKRQKMLQSESEAAANPLSKWIYEDQMSFLDQAEDLEHPPISNPLPTPSFTGAMEVVDNEAKWPRSKFIDTDEKNQIKCSFILYVEERPALWCITDPGYKTTSVRRGEWEVVLDLLMTEFGPYALSLLKMDTVNGLKEQFQNLRTTYNKTKKQKKLQSETGTEDVAIPKKWIWEDQMSFLDDLENSELSGAAKPNPTPASPSPPPSPVPSPSIPDMTDIFEASDLQVR